MGTARLAQRDRRARLAVSAMFLTNGAIFANLVPRLPELKADLALSNTGYGLAVAAFPTGALVAGLAAGAVVRRFTSARTAVACTVGLAALVFVAASSSAVPVLVVALFAAGACDAVTDVAQNAHGLRVQRIYGRSIINSMHAVWSVGALLGAVMGAAAIAVNMPRAAQLGISGATFITVAISALRYLLPGPDRDERPARGDAAGARPGWRIYGALLAMVIIAIAGAVVEDAGSSWATLYLRDGLDATGAVAVLGYAGLLALQFVGRLVGDRVVDRFGERAVARAGGLLIAAGMSAALAFPSVPGTIAGFAVAGLGVATVVPAAMHGADRLPGLRPGTGLTAVAWLMRLGFVGAPAVVGAIADASSLRVGLFVVPAAGLAIVAAAGALSGRRPPPR